MKQTKSEDELLAKVAELVKENPHLAATEIASKLGISLWAAKALRAKTGLPYDRSHATADYRRRLAVIREAERVIKPLLQEIYERAVNCPAVRPPRFPWKEIFSDDQHGIFWNPQVTEQILELEADRHCGLTTFEFINLDPWSKFRQEYAVSVTTELEQVARFFDSVVPAFGQCRIGLANHTTRIQDWIASRTDNPQVIDDAKRLWDTLLRQYLRKPVTLYNSHTIQVGSVVFSHLRPGASLNTAQRLLEHILANAPSLGLRPPFEIVAMGHTHRCSDVPARGNRIRLWEVGCSCYLPLYVLTNNRPSVVTSFPMEMGYGRVEWDRHGQLYLPGCRVVRLGYSYRLP